MKTINKKGFTLIELLAVIVILAVIMVIAVPNILNVIDSTKKSAWESNVKLIEEAIELNNAIAGTNGVNRFDYNATCTSSAETYGKDITTAIKSIVDISDTVVKCPADESGVNGGQLIIEPSSDGQFKGQSSYTIACTSSSCSSTKNE
ncbi:MAG: prepilin-type N-terminal cleavage/methylation domain-containing protein [Bacilli bacterium]|nr:prepilin-type N-terminal cleavage/methylation domain-containing protein [Bacilli bacterium]